MISLKPTALIAVPVPEDAENFDVEIVNTNKWLQYSMPYGKLSEIILEDCNLKILGTVTADTIDFEVEPYVKETIDLPEYKYGGEIHPKETYWDYEIKMYCGSIDGAEKSFRSLLTANDVLFENPHGEKPKADDYSYEDYYTTDKFDLALEQWQTAQSKVNSKYVILEKK